MTEHTTVHITPSANPVDLTGRRGFETSNPNTNYVSEHRITSGTHTESSCSSVECIGASIFSFFCLVTVVARVASLGFFITGCIFLSDENSHIPSCASHYKGWAIAMTVLFGLFVFKNEDKDKKTSTTSSSAEAVMAMIGSAIVVIMLFSGLIAGLGYQDVYDKTPDTCDVSGIPQLITWTEWILCYYTVLFSCNAICLLLLVIMSRVE